MEIPKSQIIQNCIKILSIIKFKYLELAFFKYYTWYSHRNWNFSSNVTAICQTCRKVKARTQQMELPPKYRDLMRNAIDSELCEINFIHNICVGIMQTFIGILYLQNRK